MSRALARLVHRAENVAARMRIAAMVALPVYESLVRWVGGESLGGIGLVVQSLNLWIAFVGAAIAARTGRHLALSTGALLSLDPRVARAIEHFTAAVAAAVAGLLAWAGVGLVRAERGSSLVLPGGLPNWVVELVIPAGFLIMAWRFAWYGAHDAAAEAEALGQRDEPTARPEHPNTGKLLALVAVIAGFALGWVPVADRDPFVWIAGGLIVLAVALGAPIFTAMGGLAMVLFYGSPVPVPISAVPAETYRIVASPTLPTIPLFTLAGYILAEGGASRRLVALFKEWVGWIPGGTAGAAVLVCAFFTTFTGASGVTILALGGLLLPILLKSGYEERFAIGLLAAAGSIGLLFPPSLPVILYGVVSHVPIDELYIAGTVPGLLLVGLLVGYGVIVGIRGGVKREPFHLGRALGALWAAKWEAGLPLIVIVGLFGGWMTITEAAAFTALYAFLIEVVIHRTLGFRRDLPAVMVESVTLVGGVLIILGVALGFTSYLVDAEVPARMATWVQAHVAHRLTFILLLNLFLLGVGCLMDVFSAIMVVVPLIVPIGAAFGINPLHLGILFLANLELGYLTPPVGLNLFLASYRFDKPLTAVYRMALPFLGILGLGVLLIAYVPEMTEWHAPDFQAPGGFDEEELEEAPAAEPPGGPAPAGGLAIPEGANLLDELDAAPEAPAGSAAPSGALKIPEGANLLDELDAVPDTPAEPAEEAP